MYVSIHRDSENHTYSVAVSDSLGRGLYKEDYAYFYRYVKQPAVFV